MQCHLSDSGGGGGAVGWVTGFLQFEKGHDVGFSRLCGNMYQDITRTSKIFLISQVSPKVMIRRNLSHDVSKIQ